MSREQHALAIDAGNSRIKAGLFAIAERDRLPRCLHETTVPVDNALPWGELGAWSAGIVPKAVLAGSNPSAVDAVLAGWHELGWPNPLLVRDRKRFPLEVRVDAPEKVGLDRLLNALAANVLRAAGQPMILVDTGTATTVDYITRDGAFVGGTILPGLELSARALHRYTALLPLLSLADLADDTPEPLGRNTRDAIRSGLFWGQLGAVKELISRLTVTAGRESDTPPQVLLTGGGAGVLVRHLPEVRWEPHLSLQGLIVAAEMLDLDEGPA